MFSLFAKDEKIERITCNANYLDITGPLYLKLNMLQFPDIIYFTEISMFKAMWNILPSSLQHHLVLASCQCCRERRCESSFHQKYVSTKQEQFCISYSGVMLWNSFEMCVKQISKLLRYKKRT